MANNFDRFNRRRAQSHAAWDRGGVFIDASELNQVSVDLGNASDGIAELASVVVRKSLLDIEADGKAFTPVDTGFLRSSIGMDIDSDGLGGDVGPSASYGAFVEMGTSTQAPQAYMGPALDRHSGDFEKALAQLAGGVL